MSTTKLKTVGSLEEFRRLYYPDAEPTLDYFDGVGPDGGQDDDGEDDAAADPLDQFDRLLQSTK